MNFLISLILLFGHLAWAADALPNFSPSTVQVVDASGTATRNTLRGELKVHDDDNVFGFKTNSADRTIFGTLATEIPIDEVSLEFIDLDPDVLADVTTVNSGSVSRVLTQARISTGTSSTARAIMETRQVVRYIPGHESRLDFTAVWITGNASGVHQRIGMFDDVNGLFIGYNGTSFGVTVRNNGTDTFTDINNFNKDKLNGVEGSLFTRNTFPEPIDFTKLNVFRIRQGWLGSAVILWEVQAPDGHFVTFHKTLNPNNSAMPSISNPNLRIRVEVDKSSGDSTNYIIGTNSLRGCTHGSGRLTRTSTANSTSTPITSGTTYIGKIEDVSQFANISIIVRASNASTIKGFRFEFSPDGINFDSSDEFTINANTGKIYSVGVFGKYFRVKFENGPANQTYFRLQTTYHPGSPKASAHRLGDTISTEDDAELTKAQLVGIQEDGTAANVSLSNSGSLKVAITDRPSEVRNRVKVEAKINRTALTSVNTLIYTVTPGKTLYIESFIASTLNVDNAVGEWRIRDNVTDKMSFLLGERTLGAGSVAGLVSPSLPEPIPFTSSVTVNEVSGGMEVALWFIGYEE